MSVEVLEQEIIERLSSALSVPVAAFPDDPERHFQTVGGAQVLVRFLSSEYEPSATTRINQRRAVDFLVAVVHTHLRTHRNIYSLAEGVKGALRGYEPQGVRASKFELVRDVLTREEGSPVWRYEAVFRTTMLELEG